MLLTALALLTGPSAADPGLQPIRMWLEPAGVVGPGTPLRTYVDLARDGHLVALRVTTTGRVELLFPRHPDDGTFIAAGRYELGGAHNAATFVAAEPAGTGLVLAALAPLPYRFDEFAVGGGWDAQALAASWTGADAVGAVLDIVQRMQGDGYFNYDFVRYAVAPPGGPTLASDAFGGPACYLPGCGVGVFVIAIPLHRASICERRFGGCEPAPLQCASQFGRPGRGCAEWCRAGFPCAAPERDRVVGLDLRDRARRAHVPSPPPPAGPNSPPAIEPRRRAPAAGTPRETPLARGSYVAPAPRRTAGALARHPTRPAPRALSTASRPPGDGVRPVPLARDDRGGRAAVLPVRVTWPRSAAPARATATVTPLAEAKPRTTAGSPRPTTATPTDRPVRRWAAQASPRSAGSKSLPGSKSTARGARGGK